MPEEETNSKPNSFNKEKNDRFDSENSRHKEQSEGTFKGYYQSKHSYENLSNRQYRDEGNDIYERQNCSDTSLYKNGKSEFYRRNTYYDGPKTNSFERGSYVDNSRANGQDSKLGNSPYLYKSESFDSRSNYYDRNSSFENSRYYTESYKQFENGRYSDVNDYGSRFYDSSRRQSTYDDTYKRYRLDTRYPSDGYNKPYRSKHVPAGPNNTIGVFGFNPNTTEEDLKILLNSLFSDKFEYTSKLIMDERTGLCKGFCFIDFKCLDHAITAKNMLSKESFRGQDFKCDYSYKQGILGIQD